MPAELIYASKDVFVCGFEDYHLIKINATHVIIFMEGGILWEQGRSFWHCF